MMVKTHIVPIKKDDSNKGSCGGLANYLSKETDSLFFSHDRSDITTDEAVEIIDNHSKGQITKDQAKWYSPMYSLSQTECMHIVKKLFKRECENYNDLSKDERTMYNNYLIYLGRIFQDKMAENFEKQNLGIYTGSDLVYVGVVENDRHYKDSDDEVRNGTAKSGDPKPGFNTHIHIIQSRKANNAKKSKISPNAKNIKRTHDNFGNGAVQGFNRDQFFNLIEETFDQVTGFDRNYKESYEHKNHEAKLRKEAEGKPLRNEPKNQKSNKPKIMQKKKFYSKEDQDKIFANSSLVDYFFSLEDRGVLRFEKRKGDDFIFNNLNQESGSIYVNEKKGWKDWSTGESGRLLNAVKHYEKLGHKEALDYLVDRNGFVDYEFKNEAVNYHKRAAGDKVSTAKVLSAKEVTNPYIKNYFLTRGISEDIIKVNVQEIAYERNGKIYTSGGIANIVGGYNVRNANFKGVVGNGNDISVIEGKKGEVLIFEGLVSYLSWLQLNDRVRADETVIILNSVSNTASLFRLLEERNVEIVSACVDADQAGDAFMKSLAERYKGRIDDLRSDYNLDEKTDLNDALIIEQVKNVARRI